MVYISIKLRNYPPHAHTYMYTFITEQVALKGKEPAIVKINRVQYLYVDYTFCVCSFSFLKAVREGVCVNWLDKLEQHHVDSIVLMFT